MPTLFYVLHKLLYNLHNYIQTYNFVHNRVVFFSDKIVESAQSCYAPTVDINYLFIYLFVLYYYLYLFGA
jgi:hypothetical protein